MNDREPRQFFASCARGIEYLLVEELRALGAADAHEGLAGVHFSGALDSGYRVALWSRLASRIYLQFISAPVASADELYELAAAVDWSDHIGPEHNFAVHAAVRAHPAFRDSRFAALKVKDAIVDGLRAQRGSRPSVERKSPDVSLYVFVDRRAARIGLDLLGRTLHRRGYREHTLAAPMKESLAAAIVMRSGWQAPAPLVDPVCGSGTLLIEAALLAQGWAPGRLWADQVTLHWPGHDHDAWSRRVAQTRSPGADRPALLLHGLDRSAKAIAAARDHSRAAGVGELIHWQVAKVEELEPPAGCEQPGVVIANLPYGRRLGGVDQLFDLYRVLGARLVDRFGGWQAALFSEHEELFRAIPASPRKRYRLFNGAVACTLLLFALPEAPPAPGPGVEMLVNRLRKNLKRLRKYLKKNNITCFRVYDADLPEYAAAVDVYEDWVNLQEYQAPASIPDALARKRLLELTSAVQQALERRPEQLVVRQRSRQRGARQYQRRGDDRNEIWVTEGGLKFRLNLSDYVDTGLFLDHRLTRALVRDWAAGSNMLNLFCYTASFSVYAAAGGAETTTSVDLSATYLEWGRQNLRANGFEGSRHRLIRADCLTWIASESQRYDLIVVDPPTFSNSKKMTASFDVQRDHVALLEHCLRCLAPAGRIVFSSNYRRFDLDGRALTQLGCQIEEITARTIPADFSRRRPHRCWILTR